MAKSKLRRRIKELVGGSKTYRKGRVELKAGEATRTLRRAKNRAAAKPMVGKETNAQKERRTHVDYVPAKKSTPSYGDWLKQTASAMQYQRMKRNR
jgi:hypothetical protein